MQNFETIPNQSFRFFTTKHKIFKPVPKVPFAFYNEIQTFESCTQTAIGVFNKEIEI